MTMTVEEFQALGEGEGIRVGGTQWLKQGENMVNADMNAVIPATYFIPEVQTSRVERVTIPTPRPVGVGEGPRNMTELLNMPVGTMLRGGQSHSLYEVIEGQQWRVVEVGPNAIRSVGETGNLNNLVYGSLRVESYPITRPTWMQVGALITDRSWFEQLPVGTVLHERNGLGSLYTRTERGFSNDMSGHLETTNFNEAQRHIIESLPDEPGVQPTVQTNLRVGQTVNTHEEMLALPMGTVIGPPTGNVESGFRREGDSFVLVRDGSHFGLGLLSENWNVIHALPEGYVGRPEWMRLAHRIASTEQALALPVGTEFEGRTNGWLYRVIDDHRYQRVLNGLLAGERHDLRTLRVDTWAIIRTLPDAPTEQTGDEPESAPVPLPQVGVPFTSREQMDACPTGTRISLGSVVFEKEEAGTWNAPGMTEVHHTPDAFFNIGGTSMYFVTGYPAEPVEETVAEPDVDPLEQYRARVQEAMNNLVRDAELDYDQREALRNIANDLGLQAPGFQKVVEVEVTGTSAVRMPAPQIPGVTITDAPDTVDVEWTRTFEFTVTVDNEDDCACDEVTSGMVEARLEAEGITYIDFEHGGTDCRNA